MEPLEILKASIKEIVRNQVKSPNGWHFNDFESALVKAAMEYSDNLTNRERNC